ncbi:MAG: hypothetical protein ABID32_02225 [Candidatus Omnitrophota bacterium]
MRSDLLSTRVYIAQNGKDYRTPATVDKKSITNFFSEQGYTPLEIDQKYRHAHGRLRKDKKLFFFKMASTDTISDLTRNEAVWNTKVEVAIQEAKLSDFAVLPIYATGYFDRKFYFITEYYNGPFLAHKYPPEQKDLPAWIDRIVRVNLFLSSCNISGLPRDNEEFLNMKNINEEFYNKDKILLPDLTEFQLEDILSEEKLLSKNPSIGLTHGDFVPWHMIGSDKKFILIDAELGSSKMPKYHDVAYFYERVYTGAESPDIAKSYLAKIRATLLAQEKDIFDQTIRPLIASRIIWGFWRAKNYRKQNFNLHFRLKDDFIRNNLF